MDWRSFDYLKEEYVVKGRSTGDIAKEHGTFSNTVRRKLIKLGITPRTKSQAQINWLSKNAHPMEGTTRSEEVKRKISEGIQTHFDGLTEEEMAERKASQAIRAKAKWDAMTKEEREANVKKMHKANREMSGKGSKNENMVAKLLEEAGYKTVQRSKDFSPRRTFEIDIAIPSRSVAVEWDGAAHFEPIYGDATLQKVTSKDDRKEDALVNFGWTLIRCRDHSTAHSVAFCRRAVNKIIDIIENGETGIIHRIDAE